MALRPLEEQIRYNKVRVWWVKLVLLIVRDIGLTIFLQSADDVLVLQEIRFKCLWYLLNLVS